MSNFWLAIGKPRDWEKASLPQSQWESSRVSHPLLLKKARIRQTFQMLEENLAQELVKLLSPEAPSVPASPHEALVGKLLEVGRLQRYLVDKEYEMDGAKLDAVWRRVERAVPTYVFEVQLGGDLYSALAKLKHAFDIWNSNIFLVIPQEDKKRVDQLLSGVFHEVKNRIAIIEVSKVKELFQLKMALRKLEQELGLI